ncbi:MAG: glycosyltransferase [FCB group bacterium]|nr:glycosyltransferase [FCB group bacterium]
MAKPSVLFLTGTVPYPLTTGAKIRTFNLLKALINEFNIELLTAINEPDDKDHLRAIEQAGIKCHVVDSMNRNGAFSQQLDAIKSYFGSAPYLVRHYTYRIYRDQLNHLLTENNYDVIHCDSISLTGNLKGIDPQRLMLTQHNIEQIIWAGYVAHAENVLSRSFYRDQYRKVKRLEENLDRHYGHVVTVSEEDKTRLAASYPKDKIVVVDNGVDPAAYANNTSFTDRSGVVFTGSLDWHPNIDGLTDFLQNAYQLIISLFPECQTSIVGRRPGEKLLRAVAENRGIEIMADVPEIQPFLHRARVMIVPLRIGGGSRLKILEALAAGLPVVSTSKGAEGLNLIDGENIIIRDDPEDFAKAVVSLHKDEALHRKISVNGLELIKARFAWDVVARSLAGLWRKVADA